MNLHHDCLISMRYCRRSGAIAFAGARGLPEASDFIRSNALAFRSGFRTGFPGRERLNGRVVAMG
jgi:hypothetical protein